MLLDHIDQLHTTDMIISQIKKKLKLDVDNVVLYCKNKILDQKCNIYKRGKNWYCEVDGVKITVNSYSYTIIMAHILRNNSRKNNEAIN